MQTTLNDEGKDGLNLAIIMDGNGRWAQQRGWPRIVGHRAGVQAVRRVVEAAPARGVVTLTLYAFSADNWRRPPDEVSALWRLLEQYLRREQTRCVQDGVRVSVIGRRDRLGAGLVRMIEQVEHATGDGSRLHLRLAVDYSARDAIIAAARSFSPSSAIPREEFAERIGASLHCPGPWPEVDLLIRTGGEQRLSDFLLWECAYAELFFLDCMWPDFDDEHLADAIGQFHRRQRRFGGLSATTTNKRSTVR